MTTINEIRRANLERLIREFRTIAALAEAVDTAPAYLSQLRNALGDSRSDKPRNVGDDLARKLETGANKPLGWMDQDHSQEVASSGAKFSVFEPPATYEARASPESTESAKRERELARIAHLAQFATAADLSKMADAMEKVLIEDRRSRENAETQLKKTGS